MVEVSLGGGLAALIIGIILLVISRAIVIEPWVNKILYVLGAILVIIGIILLILFFILPIV